NDKTQNQKLGHQTIDSHRKHHAHRFRSRWVFPRCVRTGKTILRLVFGRKTLFLSVCHGGRSPSSQRRSCSAHHHAEVFHPSEECLFQNDLTVETELRGNDLSFPLRRYCRTIVFSGRTTAPPRK